MFDNSKIHIGSLVHSVMILRHRASGRSVGPEGEALVNGNRTLIRANIDDLASSSLCSPPCLDTRRRSSTNQEAGPHQKPDLPAP